MRKFKLRLMPNRRGYKTFIFHPDLPGLDCLYGSTTENVTITSHTLSNGTCFQRYSCELIDSLGRPFLVDVSSRVGCELSHMGPGAKVKIGTVESSGGRLRWCEATATRVQSLKPNKISLQRMMF